MNGPQLYAALRALRRFHQETAYLLQTADAVMSEAGFPAHPHVGRTATAYYSYVVDAPVQWTPEMAFRWYADERKPSRTAFISVIFCPREHPPGTPEFKEPLISSGIASFEDGVPKGTALYHFARSVLWSRIERNGGWALHEPGGHGHIRIDLMALPLMEIDSTDALRDRVTTPLLQRLRGEASQ